MKILVVAPHPDDETFGCGGTLLKHAAQGDSLYWLIVTNVFEEHGFSKERVTTRQAEIEEVSQLLGITQTIKLDYPTMKLNNISFLELVSKLSGVVNDIAPDVIYLPHRSDIHSDHRVCFEAAYACTKSFRFKSIKKILMYECLSETEFSPALQDTTFIPNYFSDISEYMNRKIEIVKIYGSEIGEHPFPRSLKNLNALAIFRGASCGYQYAEAFMLLKQIC